MISRSCILTWVQGSLIQVYAFFSSFYRSFLCLWRMGRFHSIRKGEVSQKMGCARQTALMIMETPKYHFPFFPPVSHPAINRSSSAVIRIHVEFCVVPGFDFVVIFGRFASFYPRKKEVEVSTVFNKSSPFLVPPLQASFVIRLRVWLQDEFLSLAPFCCWDSLLRQILCQDLMWVKRRLLQVGHVE